MAAYILLSFLPLLVSCFFKDLNIDKKQKKYFLIISGIALVVFLGLRDKYIGSADTYNYYSFFEYAKSKSTWSAFRSYKGTYMSGFKETEIGFQIFVWLLSRVTSNGQVIIVVTALIYTVSLIIYIYHNSDDVVLSVVMYITLGIMFFEMQGMRQSIAMSICLLSYESLKKNKFVPFAFWVILACFFHKTAIVFSVLWLFRKFTINQKHLFYFSILGGSILVFCNKIISIANNFFEMDYKNTVDGGGLVATSIYILTIIFVYAFVPRDRMDQKFSLAFYMMLLGLVCYIVRYFGAQASERISFYFMFSQLIVLPNAICSMSNDKEKAVTKMIVVLLSIALMIYRLSGSELVPYSLFWK